MSTIDMMELKSSVMGKLHEIEHAIKRYNDDTKPEHLLFDLPDAVSATIPLSLSKMAKFSDEMKQDIEEQALWEVLDSVSDRSKVVALEKKSAPHRQALRRAMQDCDLLISRGVYVLPGESKPGQIIPSHEAIKIVTAAVKALDGDGEGSTPTLTKG